MRWRSSRQSRNIEDRRSSGGFGGSGGGGMKIGFLGTAAIVIVGWFLGINPLQMLGLIGGANTILGGLESNSPQTQVAPPRNDETTQFVRSILGETEDVWGSVFQQMGRRYRDPTLVLFTNETDSVCGYSSAATGPFYCPGDQKVYIDLGFFNELNSLGASGDFSQAYVIAHEIGHHVQNQLGITDKVSAMQERVSQTEANALSVAVELQADCYAGIWANKAQQHNNILESGDIEEAINAAASIGDDRLQRMSGRHVNPDNFTHGSSRQRAEWFQRGLQSGDLRKCDTFNSP